MSGRCESMHFFFLMRAAVFALASLCLTGCALLCKGITHGTGVTASGALAAGEHELRP